MFLCLQHLRVSSTADSRFQTTTCRKWLRGFWITCLLNVGREHLLCVAVLHAQPPDYLVPRQEVVKQNSSGIMHNYCSAKVVS